MREVSSLTRYWRLIPLQSLSIDQNASQQCRLVAVVPPRMVRSPLNDNIIGFQPDLTFLEYECDITFEQYDVVYSASFVHSRMS